MTTSVASELLDCVIDSQEDCQPTANCRLLDSILPRRKDAGATPYSLDEAELLLHSVRDKMEELQRQKNDHFELVVNKECREKLQNLYRDLHNIQLDVMRLQCDIAFTKEQYDAVKSTCDNPLTRERREMLANEANLRLSLQKMKFKPMEEFFSRFAKHLSATADTNRQLCLHQAANFLQFFDWSLYHQTIFLLRACGKAQLDLDMFERLYQSSVDIVGMGFKQQVDKINYNNFIEFPDTYSLESQLEITVRPDRKLDLKDLLADPIFHTIMNGSDLKPLEYIVFEALHTQLQSITVDACRLLLDLNMNYIEAHLTDGINIDKLNGGENGALPPPEEQALPLYAFSPQEYITQIGQHLLTLRKQTEQFDSMDSKTLKFGLESLDQAQDILTDIKSYKTVTEIIMRCIARHSIRSLLGRTNNSILSKLTPNGRRQLATDTLYLDNVLEDLGLLDPNEPNVERFKSLLKVQ